MMSPHGWAVTFLPQMNWMYSSAARAGLGPPEWIVISILFLLVCAAASEARGDNSDYRGPLLTVRDRRMMIAGLLLLGSLLTYLTLR